MSMDIDDGKPLTAFMVYAGRMREKVLEENPHGTAVDLGRQLVLKWQALPEGSKKVYHDIAQDDAKRFYRQRKEYAEMSSKKEKMSQIISKLKQESKPSNYEKAPKLAMSAYMFYSKAARKRFKQLNPRASFGDLGKLIGVGWRNLSPAERKPFEELAAQDRERHAEQKSIYLERMVRKRESEMSNGNAKRAKMSDIQNNSSASSPGELSRSKEGNVAEFRSLSTLNPEEVDALISSDLLKGVNETTTDKARPSHKPNIPEPLQAGKTSGASAAKKVVPVPDTQRRVHMSVPRPPPMVHGVVRPNGVQHFTESYRRLPAPHGSGSHYSYVPHAAASHFVVIEQGYSGLPHHAPAGLRSPAAYARGVPIQQVPRASSASSEGVASASMGVKGSPRNISGG